MYSHFGEFFGRLHRSALCNAVPCLGIPNGNVYTYSAKAIHKSVLGSTIAKNPTVNGNYTRVHHSGTKKLNVVYSQYGVLRSNEKEKSFKFTQFG